MPEPGYVYVLTNPEFPSLLKIGRTTRTPEVRAQELSGHTGVPRPYIVRYSRWFPDHHAAERYVHAVFADQRVRGKEFFRADLDEVISVIEAYQPHLRQRVSDRRRFPSWRLLWVAGLVLLLSIGVTRYLAEQKNLQQRIGNVEATNRFNHVDVGDTTRIVQVEDGSKTGPLVSENSNPLLDEVSAVFFTEEDDLYAVFWAEEEPSLQEDYPEQSLEHAVLPLHATESSEEKYQITIDEGVLLESSLEAKREEINTKVISNKETMDESTGDPTGGEDQDDSEEHIDEKVSSESESDDALSIGFSAGTEG